jgi:RHS repeat-associated protein
VQVLEAHSPSTPLAALDAAAVTCRAWPSAKTRVRGVDPARDTGTWTSTLASAEAHWASTFTCDETAAERQVVTNLRLPAQYDERFFQQAGLNLQGPYYNWSRWYLPSLGRYLEPDPIAEMGEMNGLYGPDWYEYAGANPLRRYDRTGLTWVFHQNSGELWYEPNNGNSPYLEGRSGYFLKEDRSLSLGDRHVTSSVICLPPRNREGGHGAVAARGKV